MSSGFISGGTADAPIERNDEWLAAQKEIEANRRRKEEDSRQSDGRSLYDTLQANKVAKQEAFEEANRLKNQFRALDEDEIEFLDSVLESTRAEEDRVKKETREGLELFRRQQEEADKKLLAGSGDTTTATIGEGSPGAEEEQWIAGGRKRKRVKEKEGLRGVKLRKSSSTGEQLPPSSKAIAAKATHIPVQQSEPAVISRSSEQKLENVEKGKEQVFSNAGQSGTDVSVNIKTTLAGGLGLVDYGSDDDE